MFKARLRFTRITVQIWLFLHASVNSKHAYHPLPLSPLGIKFLAHGGKLIKASLEKFKEKTLYSL